MNCEICKRSDRIHFVILPIKKPDGSLCITACLECSKESSAYCKKHDQPHLGFTGDNTTACVLCIEEIVKKESVRALEILNILKEKLPQEDVEELLEWAEISSAMTGNSLAISVLRAVATMASRRGKTVDEIVEEAINAKSVEVILSWAIT